MTSAQPITYALFLGLLACCALAQETQLPPRLSTKSSQVVVSEGQTGVVLECALDVGDDPIQYRWVKNHIWVTGSLGHAYRGYKRLLLALQPVRREHAGQYECEAKNDAGSHTQTITVVVESSSGDGDRRAVAPVPRTNEVLVELAASLSDVLAESDCLCDLLFLLHASPDAPRDLVSVQANLINTIAKTIVSQRVRVSLMTYSDYLDVKLPFSNGTNACALRHALEDLEHKMWSTKIQDVLRDVFKKFKKSSSKCKVLFLPVVGSAGPTGIDILGSQHLKKVGVTVFLLEVTDQPIPGLAGMASKRGDGKPYHWRVPLPIWPSIVTYMQYMAEELIGCQSEEVDTEGVCVGGGGLCSRDEECRGAGMGCLQGTCQSLECNVDPTRPGCCSVPGRFWCGDVTRNCTSSHSFCDGRVHCMNGRDEDTCWSRPCPPNRVAQCESTTLCLALTELCDGHHHCPAGEDEDLNFCKRFPCPSERPFRCRSGKCIATEALCDGKFMDCEEGEDEALNYCHRVHRCTGNKSFKCDYGVCVENTAVCDGNYNCLDGSDEILCGRTACPVERPFKCSNGECIRIDTVCNGHPDGCSDGSDEHNCANFTCPIERSFKCLNGRCIDGWLKCNRGDDCGDGTDELDCPYHEEPTHRTSTSRPQYSSTTHRTVAPVCRDGFFTCRSGACISDSRVCDGRSNCADGDDEEGCEEMECPPSRPHRCPSNNACVKAVFCNNIADCSDGSDEQDCPVSSTTNSNRMSTTTDKTHIEEEEYETDDEYTYDMKYDYDEYAGLDGEDEDYESVLEQPSAEPESEPEPSSKPKPEPELETEVDLVRPNDANADGDNRNGGRHGYGWSSDDAQTVPEDNNDNPAASSDRSQSSGACVQSMTALAPLLLVTTVLGGSVRWMTLLTSLGV